MDVEELFMCLIHPIHPPARPSSMQIRAEVEITQHTDDLENETDKPDYRNATGFLH